MKGTLPRVIRATRSFSTPSPDACVAQDELFILKQSRKSGQATMTWSCRAVVLISQTLFVRFEALNIECLGSTPTMVVLTCLL